jgi:hypothetical protein
LESLKTSLKIYKGELKAERSWESFENASSGWDDLSANAIARDQASKSVN